ncbi:hypothetical protein H0H92_004426 [Tricholoma furcatifolium]|nr:hypothetical protein H0H92_004426 [Tricholoma furcatifolium]
MTLVETHASNLPHIPDDLSLPQFMLDYQHPLKPSRSMDVACLIEDESGRKIHLEEVPIIYETIILSTDRQLVKEKDSMSNPQFTVGELLDQLIMAQATFIIAHSSSIATALSAARLANLLPDRVILIDEIRPRISRLKIPSIHNLIQDGVGNNGEIKERVFDAGEGKKKIALLSWSSGTTGKPKAVAISHYGLIANIIQMAAHNQIETTHRSRTARGFRPGDVAIGVLPFYHVAGLVIGLHFAMFCAMSVVVIEKYNILSTLESIVRHRITHLVIVPPLAIELCKEHVKHPAVKNHDLSAVKHILIGAAPVPKEVQAQLFESFPDAQIGQAYGLTEMTTTLAMITGSQQHGPIGSGGRLLPGVQARVIKSDGSSADYGEPGELVVKGPAMALGYLSDEQAYGSSAQITRNTFVDGYNIHCIFQDATDALKDGFIREMIKVNGFQVAPAEVEGCLLAYPDVVDCCVVSVRDDRFGELPMAFVVLTTEAHRQSLLGAEQAKNIKRDIAKHVAERLATYKHIKGGVEIVRTIPVSSNHNLRVLEAHPFSVVEKREW